MGQVSNKLRRLTTGYSHWCPACDEMHHLPDNWSFNGNVECPTFSPSFKQSGIIWSNGYNEKGIGQGESQEHICHYTITDGKIQFYGDSSHGRTDVIEMPDLPLEYRD